MTEKARAGIYPSYAPVGYRNVDGTNGKRTIVADPDTAPIITDIYARFAVGAHSVKSLVREMNLEGVQLRGRKLQSSVVHQILRKRLYTGDFDWDGNTYSGTHEPLVSREVWQQVQELLDARAENRTRKVRHDFAYTGLVHCGHCGCLLVGELKKQKYVYYHCTGNRGKCREPYTRQEALSGEFASLLCELVIPPAVLEWLGDAVLDSDRTEQAARADMIKKLPARYHQIEVRIQTMYIKEHARWYTKRFGTVQPEWYLFPGRVGKPENGKRRPYDPTRPVTTLKTSWKNVKSRAGVDGRFHDTRHTLITELAENGEGDQTIMDIAGHVSKQMLARYRHIRMEAKRATLEAISSKPIASEDQPKELESATETDRAQKWAQSSSGDEVVDSEVVDLIGSSGRTRIRIGYSYDCK